MSERTHPDLDDESPPSAADALAIIRQEQQRSAPDVSAFFLVWGAAWVLIGLGWFAAGRGLFDSGAAGLLMTGVLVVAVAASAVIGFRLGRGVSGPSTTAGAMFGLTWVLAMLGTGVLVGGLSRFTDLGVGVLAPAMFVFVAGVMYSASGSVWRSRPDFVLGVVIQVVAMASAFTPVPWNALVMGVAGGGALLVRGAQRRIDWNREQSA